jgi:hypothetical protein
MKSSLIISAIAITIATPVYAQSSDVSGPPPTAIVTFAPIPGTSASAASSGFTNPVGMTAAVTGIVQSFNAPGTSLTSSVTQAPIPFASLQLIGQIVQSGSPAGVTQLIASLQAAGAPAGATARLAAGLAAIGTAETPRQTAIAIHRATQAFNALIRSAPASFFAAGTLPTQILAVHAALAPMAASIR